MQEKMSPTPIISLNLTTVSTFNLEPTLIMVSVIVETHT